MYLDPIYERCVWNNSLSASRLFHSKFLRSHQFFGGHRPGDFVYKPSQFKVINYADLNLTHADVRKFCLIEQSDELFRIYWFFAKKPTILNSPANLMHYRGPSRWIAICGYNHRDISYWLMLFSIQLNDSEEINSKITNQKSIKQKLLTQFDMYMEFLTPKTVPDTRMAVEFFIENLFGYR